MMSAKRYRRREHLAERLKHLDVDCIAQGNSGTIGCAVIVSMRLFVRQRNVEAMAQEVAVGRKSSKPTRYCHHVTNEVVSSGPRKIKTAG
jgi:hypothetical protein